MPNDKYKYDEQASEAKNTAKALFAIANELSSIADYIRFLDRIDDVLRKHFSKLDGEDYTSEYTVSYFR